MQDENLFPFLTLRETMMFSIKLKTGYMLTDEQQMKKVASILSNLGLAEHIDTIVSKLSGGQQRRLSIAVELVDDPQVLFLDEPTTGLDSNATSQCLQLLKQLAMEGKTVICTIHQPTALLLKKFDHIYALAGGQCIYQGSQKNLVPFLAELNLICPQTYNPADFLLEIASNDYGPQNERLTEKIENGLNINFRQRQIADYDLTDSSSYILTNFNHSSFLYQVTLLIQRNLLLNKRDKSLVLTRVATYVCVGLLVGLLYFQIGNEAKHMINIFKSIYAMATYLMYASLYSLFIKCEYLCSVLKNIKKNSSYFAKLH
jgi:ATP-binding cassette, subfamily G (WHITE), member 1